MSNTKMFNYYQKGVSLYLAIVIMSILSAVVLGLIALSISGIKIVSGLENSVMSFYAANTGIERMLVDKETPSPTYSGYLDLNNNGTPDNNEDSFYDVTVTAAGPNCSANNYCVRSIGKYRDTKRVIEVNY